jgi:hypothetical protein
MIIKDDPKKNRISIGFPDPDDFITYYPEMLIQNSLPYFLQLSLYTEDNIPNLFYEKRGIPLDELIENSQFSKGSVIMNSLLDELELLKTDLSRYLIAEKTIMFEPNYIYYVAEDLKYPFKFVCIPSKKLLSSPSSSITSPMKKLIDSICYSPEIKDEVKLFDLPEWPEPVPKFSLSDKDSNEIQRPSNFNNSIYNAEVKNIDMNTAFLNVPLKAWLAIAASQIIILALYFSFDVMSENILIIGEIAWLVIVYLIYTKFSKANLIPDQKQASNSASPNNKQTINDSHGNEFYFKAVMQNGNMNIEPIVREQSAVSNFAATNDFSQATFSGNSPLLKIKHNHSTQIINLNSEYTIVTTNSYISKNPNFLSGEYTDASITTITTSANEDIMIAVTQKNSLYFIENMLRTNNILLNSRQIISSVRYNLNSGDEITIAGLYAYFTK